MCVHRPQQHLTFETLKLVIHQALPPRRNILLTHYAVGNISILHLIASPCVILISPPFLQLPHRGLPIEIQLRVTYYIIAAPKIPFQHETLR